MDAGQGNRQIRQRSLINTVDSRYLEVEKHCKKSVFRHVRFAELWKIPIKKQPNFTNDQVI